MDDLGRLVARLVDLRRMGVTVTLDDFGTGRFSLRGLGNLDLDALKIDRRIVRNVGIDAGDTAIVRNLIGLGHEIGFKVYAGGVETEAQREFLSRSGCDAAEGYLFSRPLAAERMGAWLAG
jgi:EAL domain-containing protein (putative c-di-GMP-specific phosphodiesterase class I)